MAYKSRRLKKRKKRRFTRKTFLLGVLGILLIVLFFYVSWHGGTQIREVYVSGNEFVQEEEIKLKIFEQINKPGISLVPKTSIFFYPKESIIKDSKKEFPRIKTIKVEREGLTALSIEITEKEESYLGCIDSACYYLDNQSNVFAIEREDDDRELRTYILKNETISIGNEYVRPNFFRAINVFVDALEKLGIVVTEVDLSKDNVNVDIAGETTLILSEQDNYDKEYTYIVRLLENGIFSISERGGFSENIDYVNLRFGTKIFYCEKGGECAGQL